MTAPTPDIPGTAELLGITEDDVRNLIEAKVLVPLDQPAPTPDTEERLGLRDLRREDARNREREAYDAGRLVGFEEGIEADAPPQADRGLREALNTIEQDAGWLYDNVPDFSPDGVATLKDICREIAKTAAAALRDTPPAGPTILPDDTVCACLDETGERKVKLYGQCQRCGAFMVEDTPPAGLNVERLAEAMRRLSQADMFNLGEPFEQIAADVAAEDARLAAEEPSR